MSIDPNVFAVDDRGAAQAATLERRVDALERVSGYIGTGSIDGGPAGHIAALSITTGSIAAGAITTDRLDALAVTAGKIAAQAVTADKLAAILTLSSTIQTDSSNPKVLIDSSGIFGYNGAGTEVFRVNTDTGSVAITGVLTAGAGSALPITYLTSGSLVTGTIFRLDTGGYLETSATNPRVVIDSAGWRSYNAAGVLTTEISNSAAIFQGATFRTGPVAGARLQMDSTGLYAYDADGVTKNVALTPASGLDFTAATTAAGETTRKTRWVSGSTTLAEIFKTTFSSAYGTNVRDYSSGSGSRRIVLAAEQAARPANTAYAEVILDGGDASTNARIALTAIPAGSFAGSATVTIGVSGSTAFTAVPGQLNIGVGGVAGPVAGGYSLYVNGTGYFNSDLRVAASVTAFGGAANQIQVGAAGTLPIIYFGSALDTNIYRSAANILKTDDRFVSTQEVMASLDMVANNGTAAQLDLGFVSGMGYVAGISFGSGYDVNLYRLAVDSLKTDDHFSAGGRLAVTAAAIDAAKPVIVGSTTANGNGAHLTNGGTWTNVSTAAVKNGFAPVVGVRQRLRGLRVQEWRYRDTDERHIGPTAEDFAAAFGELGTDPRGLAAMDVAGVALLATQEQDLEVDALREEVDAIRSGLTPALVAALERLDKRLARIEALPAVAASAAGGSVKGRG